MHLGVPAFSLGRVSVTADEILLVVSDCGT